MRALKEITSELAVSNPKQCEEGNWHILSQINCFTFIPYPRTQNFGCAAEWNSELWILTNTEAMWEY